MHAPAPWKIDGGFDAGVDVGIIDADGNEILGVSPTDGEDLDEWGERSIANAHLIAAAPDLLHICRAALHALRSYQHGNGSPDLAEECANEVQREIAIAEGRAQR